MKSIIAENCGVLGKKSILKYEYITETSTNSYIFNCFMSRKLDRKKSIFPSGSAAE